MLIHSCSYLTLFLGVLVVLSAAMWYFFIPIMHIFFPGSLPNASTFELFKVPAFWALLLLVPVLIAGRDFIWKFYRRQFRPHPYHIVQELKMAQKPKDRKGTLKAFFNLVFEGESQSPKKNRGFSFSQTYGQSRVLEAYGQSPRLTSSKTSLHDDGIRK
jgi:phospholipid-transporting ATPase